MEDTAWRSLAAYRGWNTRRTNQEARKGLQDLAYPIFDLRHPSGIDFWSICRDQEGWYLLRRRGFDNGKGPECFRHREVEWYDWDDCSFNGVPIRFIAEQKIASLGFSTQADHTDEWEVVYIAD